LTIFLAFHRYNFDTAQSTVPTGDLSAIIMVTTLTQPSSLIHEIQLEKVGDWNLFKFSEPLQQRMEELLEKKKADQITPEEITELDVIGELDRIFTHINAMLAAQNAHQ
jgi:hypothetical protein